MTLDEAKEVVIACINTAQDAWLETRHGLTMDGDREAVGRLANTLLEHALGTTEITLK